MRFLKKSDRQSVRFTTLMLLLVLLVAVSASIRARRIGKLPYLEHLDDTAVTIDGTDYKLRDLAFYLAYQEMSTQEQAKIYDLKQPNKYWNIHTNGSFIRTESKDAAMEAAVHDVIFYQMALADGLTLTAEETVYMENQKLDFWNDLEEYGQRRLGVSQEELNDTFLHMALAQKKQALLADENGVDYREYNKTGEQYQEILAEHTYTVNESLWDRLNFGKIIIP